MVREKQLKGKDERESGKMVTGRAEASSVVSIHPTADTATSNVSPSHPRRCVGTYIKLRKKGGPPCRLSCSAHFWSLSEMPR